MNEAEFLKGTQAIDTPERSAGVLPLRPGRAVLALPVDPSNVNEDATIHNFPSAEAVLASVKPTVSFDVELPVQQAIGNGAAARSALHTLNRVLGAPSGASKSPTPIIETFGDAAMAAETRLDDGDAASGVAANPLLDLRLRCTLANGLLLQLAGPLRDLTDAKTRRAYRDEVQKTLEAARRNLAPNLPANSEN
jgi:hypothetical protein